MKQAIFYLDMNKFETRGLLYEVWERLEADKLLESLFYDGTTGSWPEFADEILRPGCLPFVIFRDEELAAFTWLNCISSRMARTHFAVFRKFHGRKIHGQISRHTYSWLLTRKDAKGYLFDCIYGITPEPYRLVIRAAQRCGWKLCGEIPNACYMAGNRHSVGGVLLCATREILGLEGQVEAVWEE